MGYQVGMTKKYKMIKIKEKGGRLSIRQERQRDRLWRNSSWEKR